MFSHSRIEKNKHIWEKRPDSELHSETFIQWTALPPAPPSFQNQQIIPLKICWPKKISSSFPVIFFFFLKLSMGYIASGLHYQTHTSPLSRPPRRVLRVCEASDPCFCSYLVWSGPVALGWKAEGGQLQSYEESQGFRLVWEAWRRITSRGHEILKVQRGEEEQQTFTHTFVYLGHIWDHSIDIHFLETHSNPKHKSSL